MLIFEMYKSATMLEDRVFKCTWIFYMGTIQGVSYIVSANFFPNEYQFSFLYKSSDKYFENVNAFNTRL